MALQGWTEVSETINEHAFTPSTKGKLLILFRDARRLNPAKSAVSKDNPDGHLVYEDVVFMKKIVPGDRGLVVDRIVTEADKQEFPVEWANWERTKKNLVPGTPIENWHYLADSQKLEFKSHQIHTVEQFAGLDDAKCQQFMGGIEIREKARKFANAEKNAEAAAERDALKAELAELRAMIEAQTAPRR